jgi:3-phenylpropionate/trans-cinnamate dioxygenase ferredoxin reductase component
VAVAKDPIVIVGGGRAAASLVEAYREAGGDALIMLLSADERPPYNRPPLSKGFLRGEAEAEDAIVHTTDEYADMVVELRLGVTVEGLDTEARVVRLAGGEEVGYGTLVIASGARPRTLEVPGADLPAVHTFRTLADAEAVRNEAADARKALVIGGSFIGSEIAASLRMNGLEVTIVEMGERITPALASAELSDQVLELYREHGVEVLLGERIEELQANGRMLTGARTTSGRLIEAFVAVVGVGVEPNIGFLERSGIELDDGVVVDDLFRTSVADVYAIGDVAAFEDVVSGRRRRVEHWSNAHGQGARLGRNLAGGRARYDEVPVFFTKLFDTQIQLLGVTDGVDEVVVRGSIQERSLVALYLREERLVAAALVGQAGDLVEELSALIREGAHVSNRSRLADRNARPAAVFAS